MRSQKQVLCYHGRGSTHRDQHRYAAELPNGSTVAQLRMRRFLSLLMASAILLAGLALAAGEIIRPEGIRPFLLVGAGLMIGGAGWWLFNEFK